jgi:4-amino-4-deoxy-L-arabinose transferase-like glycosyltransferase
MPRMGLCARRGGRWAAVLAVSLWLGDPLVAWLAASAYIEPLVGLFIIGAIAALALGEEDEDRHAALLAGGLAGCAAATKYQGLLAVALIPLWVVARGAPAVAWTTRLRTAGPALLVAAIVALPWYAWIAMVTGDPIFPLLTRLSHAAPAAPAQGWSAVLHPGGGIRRTWWPYPPGSPWLWLLWPLPLLGWRRAPLAGRLAASGLAISVVIAVLNPDARLLTVALPLLCGALAIGLGSLALAQGNAARRALVVFALAAVLPGWLYLAHLAVARGPLPTTSAERDAYLSRELPGYRALAWLNARDQKRSTVYGLAAENLRYYAAGRFLGDWYGPASFSEVLALRDHPAALHAQLAALGVDHLLVRRVAGDLELTGTWFRAEYADDEATVWALTGAGEGH